MKIFVLLFTLAITIPTTLFPQDTLVFYYDKDWNEIPNKEVAVYYRKAFEGSNKAWIANDYFMNNQLQMSGTYKSKKLKTEHGSFVYYHENGKMKSEGKRINGDFVGDWTYYYEDGEIKSKGTLVASLAEGIWEYWYETGEKKAKGEYIHGEKVGVWNYWYPNGQIRLVETYIKGELSSVTAYYKNGKTSYEGGFSKGNKHGKWIFWNVDGRVFFKGSYRNGHQVGEWTRYFPEGEMKLLYTDGVPKGKVLGGVILSQ